MTLAAILLPGAPAMADDLRLLLGGQAHDVTTAQVLTARIEVTLATDGQSRSRGELRGEGTDIAFTASGSPRQPCARGRVCMLFTGEANLAGRRATLMLGLDLDPHEMSARGVYHLSPASGDDRLGHRMGALTLQSGGE